MTVTIHTGDCREVLAQLPPDSVDAVVCDPPYELGFMGKKWDSTGVAFDVRTWEAALRVAKPGAYLLAFGGTRTHHRMACAIEDAGWEIRDDIARFYDSDEDRAAFLNSLDDAQREAFLQAFGRPACLQWVYGSGFPKSHNGPWGGTALKPAHEPIIMARKPLVGTVAANVLAYGTGALNIDGARVPTGDKLGGGAEKATTPDQKGNEGWTRPWMENAAARDAHAERVRENVARAEALGRWPANVIHDGSEEVLSGFPITTSGSGVKKKASGSAAGIFNINNVDGEYLHGDTGSAARFFYCAKASKADRGVGNNHPTVKPIALMRYLIRLVTPRSGVVLDPFTGSGSTGCAAVAEGFDFEGVELDPHNVAIANRRIAAMQPGLALGVPA